MDASLSEDYVKVRTRCKQDVHLANVDLELWSKRNLQPLIDGLGENVSVLADHQFENEDFFAAFAISLDLIEPYELADAETIILQFCSSIENLPPAAGKIWDGCHKKVFDIGFESGNTEKSFQTELKPETLKRIVGIGASIVITIYPVLQYIIRRKEDLAAK